MVGSPSGGASDRKRLSASSIGCAGCFEPDWLE
jgi:hypothetical protein